jgi:hypothetical protein
VYRAALTAEWQDKLKAENVPHTEGTNLIKTLQDPVKVGGGGGRRGSPQRGSGL